MARSNSEAESTSRHWSQPEQDALLQGEILIQTQPYTAWGGAVTASIYLPLQRSLAWQKLTDYPRWVQYFPDLIRSDVLNAPSSKRLYQVASKAFLFVTAQVEIYLNVFEELHQRIQFQLEKGSFHDFSAKLELQDCGNGTVLTYTVQATPIIPIPSIFIQQAMNLDLPENLRRMRQVLCLA